VNVMASMLFVGVTSSTAADTSALGMLEIPMMEKAGNDRDYACALTAASSVMGVIILPSIPMIIYGMLPIIILGVILGGIFTPAVAAVYAALVCTVMYKPPSREFSPIVVQAAKTSSIVMLVCGAASIVTWRLTISMVPQGIASFVFKS
jgi:TRAP-type C4-dicarboxylate transport system permease large subunit